jgi:CubicO group peptidase (beta-lactamase class C family)
MRLHKIVLLALVIVTSPMVLATDAADFNKLDKYLTTAEANGFSGAVLIAEDGKLRLNKGYGKTERQGSTPITADTLFDTGSVTKQFTAAAVMHLVQQGKLSTTMPISRFFNSLPEDKQAITLHQLLSHSAGIANGIGARDFTHVPTDEFFNRLFALPLYFAPGEGYAYSNAGYSILARII